MFALLARSWWILTLRGMVALFYAAVVFMWSNATSIFVMILLSMYAFVDGILGVIMAFDSHENHGQRSLLLPMGLVGIGAGLTALLWPRPTPADFPYLIIIWALIAGGLEAIAGLRMHKAIQSRWLMALKGIVLATLGLTLIISRWVGTLNANYLIASGIAVLGMLAIIVAFRVGNWRDQPVPHTSSR
jgi:uncharacterized membrane protein HdeD (DUF308 family)